jgi:hypothetical protein
VDSYNVVQYSVGNILGWVDSGKVAIPEIQRPFVWSTTKVRDLIDSLYRGYPVGYLITWQTGQVKLKDGSSSRSKEILIDGQQRVTALTAALLGQQIVTKDYKKTRIQVAFNPLTERFETFTPIMRNNPEWVQDVASIMAPSAHLTLVNDYLAKNPEADPDRVLESFSKLTDIKSKQVGVINLAEDLDIETVTEIFVRINSTGARLTPADFAMSKIASFGEFGSVLRKFIDYFCHLAVAPHFYDVIVESDPEFASTQYMKHIEWLKRDSSDLFDPSYQDILRVVGLVGFGRGRMDAVVSSLAGRDFDTKRFDEGLAVKSFDKLEKTLFDVTSEYNFNQFLLILQSAGYVRSWMMTSTNAVNFAYALFLKLKLAGDLPLGTIQSVVRRWFVMSMLTGRNSGSFETQWEQDLRRMDEMGVETYLTSIETSVLSDGFWEAGLPVDLVTSSTRSPVFVAFLASQIKSRARGFLSKHVTVDAMLGDSGMGDIHHLFPKAFLADAGIVDRVEQNQVANLVVLETPINIRVGKRAPSVYMARVSAQIESGDLDLGEITDRSDLALNLKESAVPSSLSSGSVESYPAFLQERRVLMSQAIQKFYRKL